jgi:hypothetical protein
MISRRTRASLAKLMLGVLLFAQGAIAMAACDWERAAPARAFSHASAPPCHVEPELNANLCLAHCLSADQSADTPQVAVPAWVDVAPLVVAIADLRAGRTVVLEFVLPRPAAPPPRILFQTFLI